MPIAPDQEDAIDSTPPVPTFEPDKAPEFEKPPYMVVGSTFIAQSEQGDIRIPMAFKTKLFRLMPDNLEPIGMLFHLLEGEQKTRDQLDELEFEESREIARNFIKAYNERQQVRRLGESGRSSSS